MNRRNLGGVFFIGGLVVWAYGLSLLQGNPPFLGMYVVATLGLAGVLAILLGLWTLLG